MDRSFFFKTAYLSITRGLVAVETTKMNTRHRQIIVIGERGSKAKNFQGKGGDHEKLLFQRVKKQKSKKIKSNVTLAILMTHKKG